MKLLSIVGTASIRFFTLFAITSSTLSAEVQRLKPDEFQLFKIVAADPGQLRRKMSLEPILCKVARERAADMDRRHYFSHTNPSGFGPNRLVRRAGFFLLPYYDQSKSGNNIESLALSFGGPADAFSDWKGSDAHRTHLLGINPFYRTQTAIGVGIVHSDYNYYVFLSASKNTNKNPPMVILKDPAGNIISSTR